MGVGGNRTRTGGEGRNNLRGHFVLALLPSSFPGCRLRTPPFRPCARPPAVPRRSRSRPVLLLLAGSKFARPSSSSSFRPLPPALTGSACAEEDAPLPPHPPARGDWGLPRAGSLGSTLPFPGAVRRAGARMKVPERCGECVIARGGGMGAGVGEARGVEPA